jgi:hypothetical protein
MTGLDVDLMGAAQLLHRSYDWTQRNWRGLVKDSGFPRPFVGGGPGGNPWWRAAAIEAWKDRQSGLNTVAPVEPTLPPTANDPRPRPIRPGNRVANLLAAAGGAR